MQTHFSNRTFTQQTKLLMLAPVLFQIAFVCVLAFLVAESQKLYDAETRVRDIVIAQNRTITSITDFVGNLVLYQATRDGHFRPDRQKGSETLQDQRNALNMVIGTDRSRFLAFDKLVSQATDLLKGTNSDYDSDDKDAQRANLIEAGKLIRKIGSTMDEEKIGIDQLNSENHRNQNRSRQWIYAVIVMGVGGNLLFVFLSMLFYQRTSAKNFSILSENIRCLHAQKPLPERLKGANDLAELDGMIHEISEWMANLRETAAENLSYGLTGRHNASEQENLPGARSSEEIDRFKQSIFSLVNEEFRSPLTVLELTLGTLKSGSMGALSDSGLQRLEKAETSLKNLISLLNDINDIEKAERGMLRINVADAVDEDIVAGAVSTIEEQAKNAGVFVNVITEGIIFRCDEKLLTRALSNLLSNAVKNSSRGSTVDLRTVNELDGIRFIVNDSGEGIPAHQLNRVFEPFDRLEGNIKDKRGHNLGLALSKAIVKSHQGTIGINSTVGEGSAVWFVIPSASETSPPPT